MYSAQNRRHKYAGEAQYKEASEKMPPPVEMETL